MEDTKARNPVEVCEDILREERRFNTEGNIWPSVNVVIDRMLERRLELDDVYCELHQGLGSIHFGIWTFLDSVLGVAALWNPESISSQRASRARLIELNELIAQNADELADLVTERSEISNGSGFSTDCHYHIVDVVGEAADQTSSFNFWVKEPLARLRTQFDLKYWPDLSEVIRVLATDARRAIVEASDEITAAATSAVRPSKSDFVRALYQALLERSERDGDRLPDNFKMSDGAMASLVNCLLNLDPDEFVDSAYIKRFRQRERDRTASEMSDLDVRQHEFR